MMKKRGQIAMEYILIVAITLSIIIGGAYFFRSYAFESSDKILEMRVSEVASQILNKARKMHYYGEPSRSVATVEMPPQIENMFVARHAGSFGMEYNLGFTMITSTGALDILFRSDVPLHATGTCIPEPESCTAAVGYTCNCFPASFFTQGVKHFRIEAKSGGSCTPASNCITIDMPPDT
jgi:hypothetical protein